MKFFSYRLYICIVSILLLGLVVEGYGQVDCNECRPANNQRNNFVIQEAYLSNAIGERLGVSNCISGNEFWVTLNYTSRQELNNVKLLFELLVKNNSGDLIDNFVLEHFEGTVESTEEGEQKTVTIRVQLEDGKSFSCQNQFLELLNTRAFWTANANLNPNGQCGGYAQGLCSNPPLVIIPVGVDGFIYDFDFVIDCLDETESSVDVTFFITTLAGGVRPAIIEWVFEIDGEITSVNDGGFSYTIEGLAPGTIIEPSIRINDRDSDEEFSGPSLISVPELFQVTGQEFNNDVNITPFPNGSILMQIEEAEIDNYFFIWADEDGNIFVPEDPINPTGLPGGEYTLTLIDQETGICRLYTFLIDITPLPVLYKDLKLSFIHSNRIVDFSWSTTKEWEASHFEIERASQGINFEKVGEVKAAGWSDQLTEYVFEDKMLPLTGGNLLYRLKQVDFNGDYHYSEVLSVRIPGIEFTQGVWRAFPNPTDGNALQVSLLDASQYNEEPITFRLIHPMMQTPALTVDSETAMNEALSGGLSRMPKGVFVVEVQWGQKIEHIKVLKKY